MHPQNFVIFGTYKLHNAENEMMLTFCHYVNSYSPEGATKLSICTAVQQFYFLLIFTARCTLVQSAVLRSHVVCPSVRPSVRPSVTLVNCDHTGWNSSKIISTLVSLGRSLFATRRVCSRGNTPKFSPE